MRAGGNTIQIGAQPYSVGKSKYTGCSIMIEVGGGDGGVRGVREKQISKIANRA